MEKENNTDESGSSENKIPQLNSLKPFEFESKSNIGNINSSCSHDEEEGAEYEVKRISKRSGASAVQKQLLADVLHNRIQSCSFIKNRPQHRCFAMKFMEF